jgi:hypothetical protein
MRKVVAHKGCEQRGENVRGVYVYAKLYTSAQPIVASDGTIEFDTNGADWENPLYAYEIVCFDCDQSIMVLEEVETYKLAFHSQPDHYNVEVIEVDS